MTEKDGTDSKGADEESAPFSVRRKGHIEDDLLI